jgi:hypothetical protein
MRRPLSVSRVAEVVIASTNGRTIFVENLRTFRVDTNAVVPAKGVIEEYDHAWRSWVKYGVRN